MKPFAANRKDPLMLIIFGTATWLFLLLVPRRHGTVIANGRAFCLDVLQNRIKATRALSSFRLHFVGLGMSGRKELFRL